MSHLSYVKTNGRKRGDLNVHWKEKKKERKETEHDEKIKKTLTL